MAGKKPDEKSLEQVADETRDALMRYIEANTEEDDARREAERDARVKAALEQLRAEGKLPPRKPKKGA